MKYADTKRDALYTAWNNMKQRCNNANRKDYQYYGLLDIGYEAAWEIFSAFYADMHKTWAPGLTLERKNSAFNYTKDNCLWATWTTQQRNRTYNVATMEIAEQIRKDYSTKLYTLAALGKKYDMSLSNVHRIVRRESWV